MNARLVAEVVSRFSSGDKSVLDSLPGEERRYVESILKEVASTGESRILESLYLEDYERKPVSIDQFLDDDYYLGKVGVSVYPKWRGELRHIFSPSSPIVELLIRGAIGTGKTSIAVVCLLYKIYSLLCLKNPQKFYGLIANSPIVFGLFSVYKYLSQSAGFEYLKEWTRVSKFFLEYQDKGEADYLKKGSIDYPKNISIALGSRASHALSQSLYGCLLDEADFIRDKSRTEDRTQVEELYAQLRNRMDSRFIQKGGSNPGLLILISQVTSRESFMERHTSKRVSDPTVRLISYALWQMKSDQFDLTSTFKVVVGDQKVRSYIPETDDEIPEGLQVLDVPDELRQRFEHDTEGAIRDLAGVPTYGTDLFITRRDKLYECYEKATPRLHPFTAEEVFLSIEASDVTCIEDYFQHAKCMRQHDKVSGSWTPRFYPGVPRAVHIDLAKNKDSCGLSMGCIGDIIEVARFDREGRPYRSRDYTMFLDFCLRVSAVKGSEIDFSKIRRFIFYLNDLGFPIKWISADSWNSIDTLQQFKKAGFDAITLSVDRKPDEYHYLRSTMYELRFDMYDYGPLTYELIHLVDKSGLRPVVKPPIDHTLGNKKDVSDAACGVISRLLRVKEILHPSPSDTEISRKAESLSIRDDDPLSGIRDKSWVIKGSREDMNKHLKDIFGD